MNEYFKFLQVIFLSGFLPATAMSFIYIRRSKKTTEFSRVVRVLGIAPDDAEFARDRVAEQYSSSDFWMPVLFAWLVSLLGFTGLLFGADLVSSNEGKINFLLTAVTLSDNIEAMQQLRIKNMVVMTIAFLGAFTWSAQNILHRLFSGDISPSVYFSAGIRMFLAPILSLMISHLIQATESLAPLQGGLPAIAFLVGWFPERALLFLRERFPLIFAREDSAHRLPLEMIEGISTFDRSRLQELGIADAQNLANANFIELVVRTSYNPTQILDWIGQARLYVYFKDQVVDLRKIQIRTVMDMLAMCDKPTAIEDIATSTGIGLVGLKLFCERLMRDADVKQLLAFQERVNIAFNTDASSAQNRQQKVTPS